MNTGHDLFPNFWLFKTYNNDENVELAHDALHGKSFIVQSSY